MVVSCLFCVAEFCGLWQIKNSSSLLFVAMSPHSRLGEISGF